MGNILTEIANYAALRVNDTKSKIPLEVMKKKAEEITAKEMTKRFPFEEALATDNISFICECKKASPSKGIIAEQFPYMEIAKEYENAGASAISVLTEPKYFLGDIRYLNEISSEVSIPCLRKDFVVDEYMIYEAKVNNASAVLLICAILEEEKLARYIKICDSLSLSALVEVHDEEEIKKAVRAGARIIGVNNRNLKNFTVDIENSKRLRELVPANILFVAESGIKDRADVANLEEAGVNAVLIGETLMKAEDKSEKLNELRGGNYGE